MPPRSLAAVLSFVAALLACCGLGACADDAAPPPREPLTAAEQQALRDAFASADRVQVDAAIARIEAAAPPVDWLLEGLLADDRGVREWSAHAMGNLAAADVASARSESVVRALIVALADKDDYVRWKVVRALGNIGPDAALALPLIRETVATSQEILRAAGEKAIEQIEGGA